MGLKEFGNRLGNTVCAAPRIVGTGLTTLGDATRTALYGVLNPFEGLGKTAVSIKEAVHKSFTEGKWYKKLWKAPASLIATPFMAIEGVGETLWYTGSNLLRNVRDTIANPFLNIGQSFKRMGSSRKIGDFKLSLIDNRSDVPAKMRLANKFG